MLPKYRFVPEDARNFTKDGAWFRDANGRYVLFRGVNFGPRSKMPPYLPVYPLAFHVLSKQMLAGELQAVKGLLAQLKRLGFNVVRLVVQWKGIAPDPDTLANKEYLDAVEIIVEELFKLGIYSLIDFHQDLASERYGGDGFPDWAISYPPSLPECVKPTASWCLRYCGFPLPSLPLVLPTLNAMVRRTLRSFWQNKTRNGNKSSTQDMFLKSIRETADRFKYLNGVLGYEPFNEPHPVGFKDEEFEEHYLGQFYEKAIKELTAGDEKSFVFIEPRVNWTVFKRPSKIKTYLPESIPNKRTVFSFHYYDSWTQFYANLHWHDDMSKKKELWSRVFKKILHAAKKRDVIPFLTEYGCDYFGTWAWQAPAKAGGFCYKTQNQAYMDLSLQQIEDHLLNSTLWAFDLYASLEHKDNWNNEDSSLLDRHRRIQNPQILARPYPMRSSAVPSLLFFDAFRRHGVTMLRGKPVCGDPTVIYVPDEIHYQNGFEVHYTSGSVDWDRENHLLYWYPDAEQTRHQIIICPEKGFVESALPTSSRDLVSETMGVFKVGLGSDG
jgi:Cellulase (glycosyl hydrolase family 5)/Glycoside hydrolase family 5 C-terminal domain